jgi:hypothetical protein
MKLAPSIKKETGHIALGVLIGDAVMLAVFALLKRLDYTVVLGAALGSAAAILNFLFMAMNLQKAMDDPDRAKLLVQKSYTQRMLGMVVVMIIGFAAPCFHVVAVVIPFLLPSVTIKVMQLLGMYNPKEYY